MCYMSYIFVIPSGGKKSAWVGDTVAAEFECLKSSPPLVPAGTKEYVQTSTAHKEWIYSIQHPTL